MEIVVLLEPLESGGFRAKAGEPLGMTAEGESCAAALRALERLVAERLANGARLGLLHVSNATATISPPLPADNAYLTDPSYAELQEAIAENRRCEEAADLPQTPLRFERLPDDDWFFEGLREAIAENRRLEDEAETRRLEDEANR